MSIKAFETEDVTTGHAHDILNAGFGAVGVYARLDRAPLEMIDGLLSVGLGIFTVYEKGDPTKLAYFSAAQGTSDGHKAVAWAQTVGQPQGSQIFAALDNDFPVTDAIIDYQTAFQTVVKAAGYLASAYGSGKVLGALVDAGLAHTGWLSGSTGWSGYDAFKERASIVQTIAPSVLGFSGDLDEVMDESVIWTRPSPSAQA